MAQHVHTLLQPIPGLFWCPCHAIDCYSHPCCGSRNSATWVQNMWGAASRTSSLLVPALSVTLQGPLPAAGACAGPRVLTWQGFGSLEGGIGGGLRPNGAAHMQSYLGRLCCPLLLIALCATLHPMPGQVGYTPHIVPSWGCACMASGQSLESPYRPGAAAKCHGCPVIDEAWKLVPEFN